MTDRQKKAIGLFITAGLSALGGGVLLATAVTPSWVGLVITAVSALASVFGIANVSKPDVQ